MAKWLESQCVKIEKVANGFVVKLEGLSCNTYVFKSQKEMFKFLSQTFNIKKE